LNEIPNERRRSNRDILLASAIVIAVCLFDQLGAIGFVGPDEPRYAWIARAMAATHDWVTPRLYGQPWFEKPILYYWAAATGFLLHLPAEWSARLPSAFAALAAALAIGWLGWKHYGDEARFTRSPGLLAPLIFCSSVAAIGFARAATPDMLLAASTTLTMACAASLVHRNGAPRAARAVPTAPRGDLWRLVLFGAFLGLGVLAKGPVAIILAGGAMTIWALATRRWRPALRVAHPLAIGAFCVVALPWYVLCALRNPDFLRIFLLQHNFERYLTPMFHHRQPFWFFGPITLLALLPWTVLLWPVAREGLRLWREKSWKDSRGFFFACWAVFPVLFFSFSESKLPGYILPAIPPLALLCAIALARTIFPDSAVRRSTMAALGAALGATWVVLGLSATHWANRMPQPAREADGRSVLVMAAIAVAGGIGVALLAFFRKRAVLALAFFLVGLSVVIATDRLLPSLDPYISARWHGEFLHNDARPNRIFTYDVQRSWHYGLAFYLGRELREWSPADPGAALVLTTPAGLRELRRLGRVHGELEEPYHGLLYVPVAPVPH
jgi:4-amino-4-deoxy-L-arabinose transferase-like glycosyltransferase